MKSRAWLRGNWLRDPLYRFHLTAGLCDGILTALVLGTGRLFNADEPMSFSLAWRVATAGGVSGVLLTFVAHYAELRRELLDAEQELNITVQGQFATTQLGAAVRREAAFGAALGGVCTFLGAFYPLAMGVLFPQSAWMAIPAALAGLAVLGASLAWLVHGNVLGWIVFLILGGVCFAFLGLWLKIA